VALCRTITNIAEVRKRVDSLRPIWKLAAGEGNPKPSYRRLAEMLRLQRISISYATVYKILDDPILYSVPWLEDFPEHAGQQAVIRETHARAKELAVKRFKAGWWIFTCPLVVTRRAASAVLVLYPQESFHLPPEQNSSFRNSPSPGYFQADKSQGHNGVYSCM